MPFRSVATKETVLESPESIASSSLSTDNWLSSPATSSGYDRSSISSIPWAEDAINQNKDLWDKIERIFYGEEPLPAERRTREEFIDWMTKFPHLRIVGQQIPLHYNLNCTASDPNYEEIFAIDPPINNSIKSANKTNLIAATHLRHSNFRATSPCDNQLLHDLELSMGKYLRITSGPALTHRAAGDYFEKIHKLKRRSMIPLIKEEEKNLRVMSVKSEMYNRCHHEPVATITCHTNYNQSQNRMPFKHQPIKIPPIITVNTRPSGLISRKIKYIQPTPKRQNVLLPAIRLVVPSKQPPIFVRSISAVGHQSSNQPLSSAKYVTLTQQNLKPNIFEM